MWAIPSLYGAHTPKKNLEGACAGPSVSVYHGVTWILFLAHGQMAEQIPNSEPARMTPSRGDFRRIIPGQLEDLLWVIPSLYGTHTPKRNLEGPWSGPSVSVNHGVTWILFPAHGQMAEPIPSSELARVTPGRGGFRNISPGQPEDTDFLT